MNKSNNHTLLITLTLVSLIHLCLINRLFSYNQIERKNSQQALDLLLLKGNINEVKIKYNNHELDFYDTEDLEVLFKSINIVNSLNSENIDIYVNHYSTLSNQYSIEYAGKHAYMAFEKFLELVLLNEKREALKFYYISLFFKTQYHKSVLKCARNVYNKAYGDYKEGKYEEALKAINSIKIFSKANIKLITVEDSLKRLQRMIVKKQKEQSFWNTTDFRTYKLFIGILPTIVYYAPVSDITLKIENAISSFRDRIEPSNLREIHVSNIPSRFDHNLFFSINYLFLRKMMVGLDFEYSAFSIKSDYNESASEQQIFYDIKLRSYLVKSYLKYLFRDKTGISPYCNLGLGYQNIDYFDAMAGKYDWYEATDLPSLKAVKRDYGDCVLNRQKRIGIICEIGAEYIASISNFITIGSKVGGYYFPERSDFFKNYNITFSMYAGFIL